MRICPDADLTFARNALFFLVMTAFFPVTEGVTPPVHAMPQQMT